MQSVTSVPRFLVDQALNSKGTTLADFVDGGRKQGKTLEEIHGDLVSVTGVPLTLRTLYRWMEKTP